MRKLTVGSLFSGIGGIDLGLERAGMEVRWHSEIDPYASRVLAKHWPDVPNHGDITHIDFAAVEPVDVLAGGFPCQDISIAGKREGIDGERSGLWSEYARAIRHLRPGYVLVENVAALLDRGMGAVLGTLSDLGYDAEWSIVSGCSVGAPHMRRRLFIVAYSQGVDGRQGVWNPDARSDGPLQAVRRLARARSRQEPRLANPSELYRGADGVPFGMDRNRGIGNAVMPAAAELIGGWIIEHARATGYLEGGSVKGFSENKPANWQGIWQAGTENPAVMRGSEGFGFAAVTKEPTAIIHRTDHSIAALSAAQAPVPPTVSAAGDLRPVGSSDGSLTAKARGITPPIGQGNGQGDLPTTPSLPYSPINAADRTGDWRATPAQTLVCSNPECPRRTVAVVHRESGRCVRCMLEWWPA